MEQYVQEIQLRRWAEIIKAANESNMPRMNWLQENGISRDAYYYWRKKVRKYYAEQAGILPACETGLVEIPMHKVAVQDAASQKPTTAATIHIGNMNIEISNAASAEFMENLGRMIRSAL